MNIYETNYIYIPNFISSYDAKRLAEEYEKNCKEKELGGDSQIPSSSSEYNYIGFLELLCEKTPEVTKFLGEKVLPTYSYARVYKNGSVLHRHVDRESCEVSLTVHLDGDKEWPIYIKQPDGREKELTMRPGDAMMYLGCQAEHWREKFEGQKYTQVFLHYVKSRGKNAIHAFDKIVIPNAKDDCETTKLSTTKPEVNKSVLEKTLVVVDEGFQSTPLEDFIITFDDIIDDDLCNQILKEYSDEQEWAAAQVGSGKVDARIRNVDTIGMSFSACIQKNESVRRLLDEKLFHCAGKAIEKYNEMCKEARIEEDSGYELLRYKEGQYYKEHTDSFKLRPRAISCSFALNDDYEGGEWGFFENKIKIKPKKGSVVMFPSNFMYPHEINTVTKGTRYSIITWFI